MSVYGLRELGKRPLSVLDEYNPDNFQCDFLCLEPLAETRLIRTPDCYTFNQDRTFVRRGSIRGVRNGVKRMISQLQLHCQWTEEDQGKVVIYMTSLGVVRRTWEKCRLAVAILENHLVDFERRDLSFNRRLIEEFYNRMGNDPSMADLPTIFVDGKCFGGVDLLEKWSENGLLKKFFEPYKRKPGGRSLCQKCYGFGYYPCIICGGSKKSPASIYPAIEGMRLKCTRCDYGGLVACNECRDGYRK